MKKLTALLLSALLAALPLSQTALANSAQNNWTGTYPSGAVSGDEDCPLTVTRELLTFRAPDFPSVNGTFEEFLAYEGSVTAEYEFHNPADYAVTATLLFPFGRTPEYGYFRQPGETAFETDTEKYDVTVNGEPVEKKLRYTYVSPYREFDLETDLAALSEAGLSDGFFRPDLPVTEYSYSYIVPSESESSHLPTFRADFAFDDAETRVYCPTLTGLREKAMEVRIVDKGSSPGFRVYVFGEPLREEPVWVKIPAGSTDPSDAPPEWSVDAQEPAFLCKTGEMTFRDFALSFREEGSAVSDDDWCNAMTADFQLAECIEGFLTGMDFSADISQRLMRWYEYQLTVGPGETVKNTVTAPLYPSVERGDPPVYTYTYLLSPAKTWAAFGPLEIRIETPHTLNTSNQKSPFQKTDAGYALSLDGLPDGELTFVLTEKSPGKPAILLPALLLGAAALAAVVLVVRQKGKKARKTP